MQALPGGRVLIVQGQLTDPRLAQSPGDGAADAAAAGEQRLLTCRLKTLRLGGELKADAVQHIALQTAIRQFADHIDGVESAGAGVSSSTSAAARCLCGTVTSTPVMFCQPRRALR